MNKRAFENTRFSFYIQSLTAVHGGEGIALQVRSADGESEKLTVSVEDYAAYDLQKGEIDEVLLFALRDADAKYTARRAAIRILASGQCSEKKLCEKLLRRGFAYIAAKDAAAFALERGYIDEDWQIESYLKTLVKQKLVGRHKVVPMLLAKGYDGAKIRSVLESKYTDADFAKYKKAFLLKKFGKTAPETREEALEMQKALYKQGY